MKKGIRNSHPCRFVGGSPSNVSLSLLSKFELHILTGVNMPMLIELLTLFQSEEDTTKLIETVRGTSVAGIYHLNRNFIKK